VTESPIQSNAGGVKFTVARERRLTEAGQPEVWVVYVGGHEIGVLAGSDLDANSIKAAASELVAEWAREEGANPSLGGEE
jgi:hypothetical protein